MSTLNSRLISLRHNNRFLVEFHLDIITTNLIMDGSKIYLKFEFKK